MIFIPQKTRGILRFVLGIASEPGGFDDFCDHEMITLITSDGHAVCGSQTPVAAKKRHSPQKRKVYMAAIGLRLEKHAIICGSAKQNGLKS